MVPHRQPRAVKKYWWARSSSTPLVPCSLCFQFIDRVVEIRGCGCLDIYAQCKLCSFGECGVNCSDKFQQFLVGCERPCDPAARRSWVRGALLDSRYIVCVSKGDFWNNFWRFYVNGYTRLLRSILVLLFSLLAWKWPRSSSTQAVAYFFYRFCWY